MDETGLLVTNVKLDLIVYYVARKSYEAFASGANKIIAEDLISEINDLTKARITSSMKMLERIEFLEFTQEKGEYAIRRGVNFDVIVGGGKADVLEVKKARVITPSNFETLKERKMGFLALVRKSNEEREKPLPKDVLNKFFAYWSEVDLSTSVMKWENKKHYPTWEPERRLSTWYSNAVKNNEIYVLNS